MLPGAGFLTTKLAFRGSYLYITEAEQNIVWHVKTNIPGRKLYGDR